MKNILCLLGFHKFVKFGKNGDFDVFKCTRCSEKQLIVSLFSLPGIEITKTEDGYIMTNSKIDD